MKLNIIIITLLVSFLAFSQNPTIDSLKIELKQAKEDTKKIEILEKLNTHLINSSDPTNSIEYFQEMAILAKKNKKNELESRAYKYISECYIRNEDFNNAEKFALGALSISQKSDDTNFYLIDINQLGRVYHHFQKYEKAINTYKKGIIRYNSKPEGNAIATIYSNLGISYDELGDSEKMINCYLKSANYADKLKNYNAKSSALYNIGYTYMELDQYEKAEKYFLKGLKDSTNVTLDVYVNIHFHALGLNYSRWDKYEESLKYNLIALKNFQKVGDKLYEFDVLNNIATLYSRWNRPLKSIEFAKKALKLAKDLNHKLAIAGAKQTLASNYIDIKEYNKAETLLLEIANDTIHKNVISLETKSAILQNLSSVYEGQTNFKLAFEFYKKFKMANDSILIEKRDSKVTEIETKYQTEKKELENLKLKNEKIIQFAQLENEKTQKWYLGGGLSASVITLFIFGYYYNKNKKQKLLIENLQKELHHRIKNNLSIISTFIDVTIDETKDVILQTKLTELQNRIASIHQIHQQLYTNTDIVHLSLKKYIETLVLNVENSFSNKNITVLVTIAESLKIAANQSFPIGLIVNEFITNSFKYAFETNQKGTVEIKITEDNSNFILFLCDNGKGLPTDFDINNTPTFGIRIVKLLSEQLNGSFNLKSENGVNLTIRFPKKL